MGNQSDARGSAVEVRAAKGRPMLTWVGKRPLAQVRPFPAQHVETFDPRGTPSGEPADPGAWKGWPAAFPKGGLLFHGDNEEVLAHLLANGFRGNVKLVYIDPPFDSGADYVRKVSLRGGKGTAKVGGEGQSLGEQIQYTDIWSNDNYLQFMFERLLLLRELLASDGALWLHCDWHRSHLLRMIGDEVFGPENFRNEVIWCYPGREMHIENKFNAKHDNLLFWARSDQTRISMKEVALAYDRDERVKGLRRKVHTDEDGREWVLETRGQAAGQEPYKRYLDEIIAEGRALNDVWSDVQFLRGNDPERTGFPSQKPQSLVERVVLASTSPGDIVLDCFIGSGTTAAVAQRLGRRWIGCDINKGAIQTTAARLSRLIHAQATASAQAKLDLPSVVGREPPLPAQAAFTTWRVNDYDLQVQHNEAVRLACERIGVERIHTDPYFDGTLGHSLVRVVPFQHPLSPLDLEQFARELKARPEEDRAVIFVCLGAELAASAWIEEWNRFRTGANRVNRIEVIELRTDPKYGGLLKHEPATARVEVTRQGEVIRVRVLDFLSPSILQRLRDQAGAVEPRIDDWRAMVDSVCVDTSWDGQVFDVVLQDVPESRTDLVKGTYEIPAPEGTTMVAVKVTDMLGEEVITTHEV